MAAGRRDSIQVIEPMAEYGDSDAYLDKLIEMTRADANWAACQAHQLCDRLEMLEEHPRWKDRLAGEPKTWDRFYTEVLGWPSGFIARIREGLRILGAAKESGITLGEAHSAAQRAAAATTPEVVPSGQGARTDIDNLSKCSQPDRAARNGIGVVSQRKLDRLARERPDLRERIIAGELSIDGAYIAAGWKEPTIIIPRDPTKAARRLREHFQGDRLAALIRELGGPS